MSKIALPRPRILYTEDTTIHSAKMIPMMERLLNAQVTHTTDNGDAESVRKIPRGVLYTTDIPSLISHMRDGMFPTKYFEAQKPRKGKEW